MGITAIVLGAAAGGGFPQWNCNCDVCRLAWTGDPRVRPRTQASLAVSADGMRWALLNASPDLRAQIAANTPLHPRGKRTSPIEAVVLTGAEIDQTAGLLSLRERSPFQLIATAATLAAIADNPMFGALASDVVNRRAIAPGERFVLGGLQAELFIVPGKAPLYLEGGDPEIAAESAANVGVEISDGSRRLAYVPGAAAITPALRQRLDRADAILFDGTLFTDDEMLRTGTGTKTGRRMGHMPIDGEGLARRARRPFGAQNFRAHQQHQSHSSRWLARAPPRRGRRLAGRVGRHGDRAVNDRIRVPGERSETRDPAYRKQNLGPGSRSLRSLGRDTKVGS